MGPIRKGQLIQFYSFQFIQHPSTMGIILPFRTSITPARTALKSRMEQNHQACVCVCWLSLCASMCQDDTLTSVRDRRLDRVAWCTARGRNLITLIWQRCDCSYFASNSVRFCTRHVFIGEWEVVLSLSLSLNYWRRILFPCTYAWVIVRVTVHTVVVIFVHLRRNCASYVASFYLSMP